MGWQVVALFVCTCVRTPLRLKNKVRSIEAMPESYDFFKQKAGDWSYPCKPNGDCNHGMTCINNTSNYYRTCMCQSEGQSCGPRHICTPSKDPSLTPETFCQGYENAEAHVSVFGVAKQDDAAAAHEVNPCMEGFHLRDVSRKTDVPTVQMKCGRWGSWSVDNTGCTSSEQCKQMWDNANFSYKCVPDSNRISEGIAYSSDGPQCTRVGTTVWPVPPDPKKYVHAKFDCPKRAVITNEDTAFTGNVIAPKDIPAQLLADGTEFKRSNGALMAIGRGINNDNQLHFTCLDGNWRLIKDAKGKRTYRCE
jgi:hypothetical protein